MWLSCLLQRLAPRQLCNNCRRCEDPTPAALMGWCCRGLSQTSRLQQERKTKQHSTACALQFLNAAPVQDAAANLLATRLPTARAAEAQTPTRGQQHERVPRTMLFITVKARARLAAPLRVQAAIAYPPQWPSVTSASYLVSCIAYKHADACAPVQSRSWQHAARCMPQQTHSHAALQPKPVTLLFVSSCKFLPVHSVHALQARAACAQSSPAVLLYTLCAIA